MPSDDGTARVWDTETGTEPVRPAAPDARRGIALLPDGRHT